MTVKIIIKAEQRFRSCDYIQRCRVLQSWYEILWNDFLEWVQDIWRWIKSWFPFWNYKSNYMNNSIKYMLWSIIIIMIMGTFGLARLGTLTFIIFIGGGIIRIFSDYHG